MYKFFQFLLIMSISLESIFWVTFSSITSYCWIKKNWHWLPKLKNIMKNKISKFVSWCTFQFYKLDISKFTKIFWNKNKPEEILAIATFNN